VIKGIGLKLVKCFLVRTRTQILNNEVSMNRCWCTQVETHAILLSPDNSFKSRNSSIFHLLDLCNMLQNSLSVNKRDG